MSEPSLIEFWDACGGEGALRLLIEQDPRPAKGVVIPTPFAVVGRSHACDLVLQDAQISRRHAYLQVIAGQLWRFDLLSRTGTIWKQRRESVGLFDGTEALQIGPFQLRNLVRVEADPGAANPLCTTPPEQDPLPTVTLEFPNAALVKDTHAMPTWQLDRVLTYVGHSPLCKVCFKCPTVSRIHCSLLRTRLGVWIIDLLGQDGITINGILVRFARLCDGDCLKIGRFEMRVREEQRRTLTSQRALSTDNLTANEQSTRESGVLAIPPQPYLPTDGATPARTSSPALTTVLQSGVMAPSAWSGTGQASNPVLAQQGTLATDATHSLVLTLVSQFSMMQQQMFDQFQQSTMMMMQMFSTLQRDQFDLIRQEMDGLRALNREIELLQAELGKYRTTPPNHSRSIQQPPAPLGPDPTAAPTPLAGAAAHGPSPAHRAIQGGPGQTKIPDKSARKRSNVAVDRVTTEPTHLEEDKTRPVLSASPGQDTPRDPVNGQSTAAVDPPGQDVHAWLCQRFTDLQQERQSRWQKIVGTLLGK